ncbi:MAG: imidazole glycerol phosphate synthase subunit HisH [Sedimentisphaerales bacterium]|jgi:glutamine amidotransferase|nr:imidazole glycerol phosphate synthase subunit HisH [Sedimentisphaerales bacterium]HNY79942.1 imidazole glycerol phosphate synthase subunit HisH [Sedimentisphaerales bacterium]HOC64882.1 imidazole glycerol phosphate synthase subunit HisH [Sedimentisphaerales bacterium]HOH64968.1 imidazole glycerol phosphate synthase subunit HisH [Sedimentisphaerales bacterium]HPY50321.1 imidazole glycerol phosphate synthase subunit HisH [Sedimentisphaerales bacterium]
MIVVIDYNIGNVRSVCNAFRHIGCDIELSRDAGTVENARGLVLPGVAAFGYAVNALGSAGELVKRAAAAGKPILGICVGYQMLFEESCEYGPHRGLGLIRGNVVALPPAQPVPHMGWNRVELPADMALFSDLGEAKHFYFAHSYYAQPADERVKIAYTDYGFALPASVQKDNIHGVQFHPEKSGRQGLKVLQNFYEMCTRKAAAC